MHDQFAGVIPALLTPFYVDNSINHTALRELVQLNIKKKVNGFYVGGSTSEAFLMSPKERKQILETVVDETNDRAKVIAHVGSMATHHAIELATHARSCGADAVSAVTPFYYPYTFEELKSYYYDIADSVDLPMIVYNFPAYAGVTLTTERARELLNHERIIGIKHTSSDFFALERFKSMGDTLVFNGFDEMYLSGLMAGADGGIGSTYNFMAERFVAMYRLFKEDKVLEAQALQKDTNNIIETIVSMGVLQAEKAVLTIMGIDMGECRKPFKPLTTAQFETLERMVEEHLR